MDRIRVVGGVVLVLSVLAIAWSANGWPPLAGPAYVSGSDYVAVSSAQVIGVVVAAIFALIGVVMVIDGRGGPEDV